MLSKVTKSMLLFLVISILAGCGLPAQEQLVGPAPLSSAPTVQNPATQELTLVPETEVVTETLVSTETPVSTGEIISPEFSKRYPPSYRENYVAEIEGMQIPIDFGLSYWVTARPDRPIKTAHIAEDIVPILAEIYLKSCHHRFTNMMEGNEGVTYEEYVELVREGKGNLEMYVFNENKDDIFPELMSIDPRQGFAISLVDELLPMEQPSDTSLYVGSDGSGKYFAACQVTSGFLKTFYDDFLSYGEEAVWATLFAQIYQSAFSPIVTMENDCLRYPESANKGKCSLNSFPINWREINQKMTDEMIKNGEGKRGPVFEMTQ